MTYRSSGEPSSFKPSSLIGLVSISRTSGGAVSKARINALTSEYRKRGRRDGARSPRSESRNPLAREGEFDAPLVPYETKARRRVRSIPPARRLDRKQAQPQHAVNAIP